MSDEIEQAPGEIRAMPRRCGDCVFWMGFGDHERKGTCHRHAPISDEKWRTLWPITYASGFCGDFEATHAQEG